MIVFLRKANFQFLLPLLFAVPPASGVTCTAGANGSAAMPSSTAMSTEPAAATVECPAGARAAEACKVDGDTCVGWRAHAANSQVCHGTSGMGLIFAPSLLDRLSRQVDHARFL